jgi:hypothetical protein
MSSFDKNSPVAAEADVLRRQVEHLAERMDEVTQLIDQLVGSGAAECLPDAALQQLFKACVRLYSQKIDAGERITPCGETRDISATSIMVTTSGLLKGANLELFELGMWQSFSGTR